MRAVGIPAEVPHDSWKLPQDSLLEMLTQRADEYLADCAKRVPAELLAATRVVVGVAWQAVCSTAQKEGCDLIVIGSHGYSGLDRLVGTTAAKVVNHADRSVLVVRDGIAKES